MMLFPPTGGDIYAKERRMVDYSSDIAEIAINMSVMVP